VALNTGIQAISAAFAAHPEFFTYGRINQDLANALETSDFTNLKTYNPSKAELYYLYLIHHGNIDKPQSSFLAKMQHFLLTHQVYYRLYVNFLHSIGVQ